MQSCMDPFLPSSGYCTLITTERNLCQQKVNENLETGGHLAPWSCRSNQVESRSFYPSSLVMMDVDPMLERKRKKNGNDDAIRTGARDLSLGALIGALPFMPYVCLVSALAMSVHKYYALLCNTCGLVGA